MVLLRQVVVGLDNLVQIRLHQLEHDVDVTKLAGMRRQHHVLDLHHVWVLQLSQQLDLTQDTRRVLRRAVPSGGREGRAVRSVERGEHGGRA